MWRAVFVEMNCEEQVKVLCCIFDRLLISSGWLMYYWCDWNREEEGGSFTKMWCCNLLRNWSGAKVWETGGFDSNPWHSKQEQILYVITNGPKKACWVLLFLEISFWCLRLIKHHCLVALIEDQSVISLGGCDRRHTSSTLYILTFIGLWVNSFWFTHSG